MATQVEQKDAKSAKMNGKSSTKQTTRFFPSSILALFCFVLPPIPANSASAQTLLRWKLDPGEALKVHVRQETTSTVGFSGKSATTQIDLAVELLWTVTGADEKGIRIKQSVQRITFELKPEKAAAISYDSAAPGRPTGQARQVADAVKPLLGAEVEITMTDRGEISGTRPANSAAEKLFAAESSEQTPGVFSRQAVQTFLRQPLVLLSPQAVSADDRWTQETELKSAAGTFKQTTTYRLAGQQEEGGQKLDKIELSGSLAAVAAGSSPSKLTLKSHEQSGSVLFSAEQGRLVSAEQTQKLTTERPYRETTIVVTLESKQTTTVQPVSQP